jgi:hypothetical protein
MASIVAATKAGDNIRLSGEGIGYTTFALVTPLCTDHKI